MGLGLRDVVFRGDGDAKHIHNAEKERNYLAANRDKRRVKKLNHGNASCWKES